jgi:ABC-2 type transport system permease protein
MRTLTFAKRNFKELVRDPLSSLFLFSFPILMFLLFKIIKEAVPDGGAPPQFEPEKLAYSLPLFSLSFLILFGGQMVSNDRNTSFVNRLKTTPLKYYEFLFGYTIPLFAIAIIQILTCFVCGIIFGMPITINLLYSFLNLLPFIVMFILLGLLIGSFVSAQTAGGIGGGLVSVITIFSGMFMPIENMKSGFIDFVSVMPFYPITQISNGVYNASYFIVSYLYLLVFTVLSLWVFHRQFKYNK